MPRVVRRMASAGHNRSVVGPREIEIATEGVRETTPTGETRHTWAAVERIAVDDGYIYIYIQPMAAHLIPKSAFETPSAVSAFVEQANAYHARAHS